MFKTFNTTIRKCVSFNSLTSARYSTNDGQHCTDITQKEGVREICLNNPKTRNCLSMAMMESLLEGLTHDWNNKELRSIVLTAKGSIWSSGHNLKELTAESSADFQRQVFEKLTDIIMNIQKAPVPVIAKVNGYAAAAGCQLVASCDIIVASENSKFSTPGANFGIFCSTPGIALARVMPRPQAAYMLMTGLPITAREALMGGLASRVVPESELDNEVKRITDAIQHKSRAVVDFGKQFFYKQLQLSMEQAFKEGAEKMTENLGMSDSKEGLRSFIEKRQPHWKHV